jgi:heme-degrading monooxygenase HmoA
LWSVGAFASPRYKVQEKKTTPGACFWRSRFLRWRIIIIEITFRQLDCGVYAGTSDISVNMFIIVWEFTVKSEAVNSFQRAYGPEGEWVQLFRRSSGYRGTRLLVDTEDPRRFITIDHWTSEAEYKAMQQSFQLEYAALDAAFAEWTESEREIGTFLSERDSCT